MVQDFIVIRRIAIIFLCSLTYPEAFAQTAPTRPNDPIEAAAFDALDRNCSRCHQTGKLVVGKAIKGPNGELLPRKEFGFVTDLAKLTADKKIPLKIVPGKPLQSEIIKRIDSDDIGGEKMPADYLETSGVSKDDRKAIVDWISSLTNKAVASCGSDHFISNKEVYRLIAADLDTLLPSKRTGTRYLSLVNLYNRCLNEQSMQTYRQASAKLLNSLSRSADVLRPRTVGPSSVLLAFNIGDLKWTERDWVTIVTAYPYRNRPDTVQIKALQNEIGTPLGVIRADWFAENASHAPLYDTLLQLPKTFAELQKLLNVDVTRNINENEIARAGFQHSGVSINANRMVERHRISSGYFWTSYDFKSSEGNKSLFSHPFGPGGNSGFQPDGGETIFSLPNGFQGYYLNDATGKALARAPVEVVQDPDRFDKTVTNGISCMGCHASGMRLDVKDEIRSFVADNHGSFDKPLRDKINSIHPLPDEMSRILLADQKRFLDAEKNAGIDLSQLSGREPINALVEQYESGVDAAIAAAELGLGTGEFASAVEGANGEARTVGRRLQKGPLRRSEFEGVYGKLVTGLTDENFLANFAGQDAGSVSDQAKTGSSPVVEQPATVLTALEKGTALFESNKYSDAAAEFNAILRDDPTNVLALIGRGRALTELGDTKNGILDCTKAIGIGLGVDLDVAYNCRGYGRMQEKSFDLALADFSEAIKLNPKNPRPFKNRATILYQKELYDRALMDLSEAIRLDRTSSYAFGLRGAVFYQKNNLDSALEDLSEALRLYPKDAFSLSMRADIFMRKKDFVRAQADAKAGLLFSPNDKALLALKERADDQVLCATRRPPPGQVLWYPTPNGTHIVSCEK